MLNDVAEQVSPMRRKLLLLRLPLGIGLVLALMKLVGLPASHAGPGPDPQLRQTATPTAVATTTPRIELFRATPDTLVAGESFVLEWRSVDATRALLFTDDLPHGGPVPPTGSMRFKDVPAGTYGLRLVVENDAGRSDREALTVHVAQRADVVIVDDDDPGFVRHGNPAWWWEADIGYANHMIYTFVNGDVISNWIEWRPDLPVCGDYAVSAFIPRQHATTQEARYEVYFKPGSEVLPSDEAPRVVVVDQSTYFDQWVPLGTFRFDAGQEGYVRLTDATGEDPNSGLKLGFDATRFQLRQRCATRVLLPLVHR